jgi:tRNA(Ile)-lysidine synthase
VLSPQWPAEPAIEAEFAAALEALADFEPRPFLAVAVSGGPDSLALAILADRWARNRGGRICALTVDHRLRPESADEVRQLGFWLTARGIRHEVLVWAGAKPATGIEAAARMARYRLLEGWCRRWGCLHLLTAHHRDDQRETHLIRRRAGSGPDGLAGMSAVRELGDCRLLRPLLGIAKSRLAAVLARERQPAITDPSNLDPAFARARLRLGDAAPALPAVKRAHATTCLAAFGRMRQAREHARDRLLARAVMLHPAGFAALEREPLRDAPPEIADLALAALVTMLGGRCYAPRHKRVARLRAALTGGDPDPPGRTLGGCRFVPWRGRVLVLREAAAAEGMVQLAPGTAMIWDRRFRVSLAADAAGEVGLDYLGTEGAAELARQVSDPRRSGLPLLLHPVLPTVWDQVGVAAVPALGYRRVGVVQLPQIVLRPLNCLAAAPFAVV